MSKLVIKVFTTFDEQMQILEERKLNFSNLKEKDKMRNYLVKFGYRNLITEYSSHFMISFDLNMKQYTQNVYASHIMNLFELDINISEILLSKIFEIERRLSTSISYCLMQHYKMKYPVMNNGLLLTLKDEEIADIFTSWKRCETNIKTISEISPFLSKINDYDFIQLKQEKGGDVKNIPLWELASFWTLGTLVKIYNIMNVVPKQQVFYSFSTSRYPGDFNDFFSVLQSLQFVRNKLCHNRKIFDFNIKKGKEYIHTFSERNNLDINIKDGIRLFDLIKIIDKLNFDSSSLYTSIKKQFDSYFYENNLPKEIEKHIKDVINYI